MKRKWLWTAALCALLGCMALGAVAEGLVLGIEAEDWKAAEEGRRGYWLYVEVPQVSGLADGEVQARVNAILRDAAYAAAWTAEDRRAEADRADKEGDTFFMEYRLQAAWYTDEVLGAYVAGNISYGASGSDTLGVAYADLRTGEAVDPYTVFVGGEAAREALRALVWGQIEGGAVETFFELTQAEVLGAEPTGLWVSREGVSAVYATDDLDRRLLEVPLTWETLGALVDMDSLLYRAVTGDGLRQSVIEPAE